MRPTVFTLQCLLLVQVAAACQQGKPVAAANVGQVNTAATAAKLRQDAATGLWFADYRVIGEYPSDSASLELSRLGVNSRAEPALVPQSLAKCVFCGGKKKAWQNTSHVYGFFAPSASNSRYIPLTHAGTMPAGTTLKGARINIRLDAFHIEEYPGGGMHRILFDFYAQNQQTVGQAENVHFNTTVRAQQGQDVPAIGLPIFLGLGVTNEGVLLNFVTVNTENESDQKFLDLLESDNVKSGLKLLTTAQPAIAPLASMATGVTKAVLSRNKNVAVENVDMGLDFNNGGSGARLAEGSYVVVQVPREVHDSWDWSKWKYDTQTGNLVSSTDSAARIGYNFWIFRVNRAAPDSGQ